MENQLIKGHSDYIKKLLEYYEIEDEQYEEYFFI